MSTLVASAISLVGLILRKPAEDAYNLLKDTAKNKHLEYEVEIKRRGDISNAKSDHELASLLWSVSCAKTVWSNDISIDIDDFYYPSKIVNTKKIEKNILSIRDIGSSDRCYVIEGTAGQGKSIFLKYLCRKELITETTTRRIPVFIELKFVKQAGGLMNLIINSMSNLGFDVHDKASFQDLIKTGAFVLLLDAFDEIDPDYMPDAYAFLHELSYISRTYLQIIVTSRPSFQIQNSSHFCVIQLAELKPTDHNGFLDKLCHEKEKVNEVLMAIKSSRADVGALLTTPLLLTLLFMLYRSTRSIPDTVPKFYEELFDVLFYRHDQTKGGVTRQKFSGLDHAEFKKLFSAFCFFSQLQSLFILTTSELELCLEEARNATGLKVKSSGFIEEATKNLCLLNDEVSNYSFIHRSVAEYYAAVFLAGSSIGLKESFYNDALLDNSFNRNFSLSLIYLEVLDLFRFSEKYAIPLLFSTRKTIEKNCSDADNNFTKEYLNYCGYQIRKNRSKYKTVAVELKTTNNHLFDDLIKNSMNDCSRSDKNFEMDVEFFSSNVVYDYSADLGFISNISYGIIDDTHCGNLKNRILFYIDLALEKYKKNVEIEKSKVHSYAKYKRTNSSL